MPWVIASSPEVARHSSTPCRSGIAYCELSGPVWIMSAHSPGCSFGSVATATPTRLPKLKTGPVLLHPPVNVRSLYCCAEPTRGSSRSMYVVAQSVGCRVSSLSWYTGVPKSAFGLICPGVADGAGVTAPGCGTGACVVDFVTGAPPAPVPVWVEPDAVDALRLPASASPDRTTATSASTRAATDRTTGAFDPPVRGRGAGTGGPENGAGGGGGGGTGGGGTVRNCWVAGAGGNGPGRPEGAVTAAEGGAAAGDGGGWSPDGGGGGAVTETLLPIDEGWGSYPT